MANAQIHLADKAAITHNLISTSYHEAGHTIYGLLHLIRIESVHLLPAKEDKSKHRTSVGGLTHFVDFLALLEFLKIEIKDPELLKFIITNEVSFHYAGLSAEKYHFKNVSGSDKSPEFLKDGAQPDTLTAAKLIKQYNLATPGKKRYLFKKKIIANVLKELQLHWEAVNLIAHGLFQRRRLYLSDIKKILTRKSENKIFWREQFKIIDSIYEKHKPVDENDLKIKLEQLKLL